MSQGERVRATGADKSAEENGKQIKSDLVTIYVSGLGPTNPPITPGAVASGAANMTSTFAVTLDSVTLDASDVLYAGSAPGELISQLNIRIPVGTPAGNQPSQIEIPPGGPASPPGAYLAITAP